MQRGVRPCPRTGGGLATSLYLVAIMDWYSRKVLSWRLSNSMEADFCVEALKEAIDKYGKPEIMNMERLNATGSREWATIRAASSPALNGHRP